MTIIDINGKSRECVKAYPDPSFPGFMKIEIKNARRSYSEWYPIEEFMNHNPDFSAGQKSLMHKDPEEITSVPTASTKITLTDSAQNWQSNIYAGFPLWIAIGKGEGQVRTVLSNTKHTLVLDKQWDTRPNKYSQYVLSRNIQEKMPAAGNQSASEIQHKYELRAKRMDRNQKKKKP